MYMGQLPNVHRCKAAVGLVSTWVGNISSSFFYPVDQKLQTNWVSKTQLMNYNRLFFHPGEQNEKCTELKFSNLGKNQNFLSPQVIGANI